jgi:hypothetical protein
MPVSIIPSVVVLHAERATSERLFLQRTLRKLLDEAQRRRSRLWRDRAPEWMRESTDQFERRTGMTSMMTLSFPPFSAGATIPALVGVLNLKTT